MDVGATNSLARLDHKPETWWPYEMPHGKRPRRLLLPFMMEGFHHVGQISNLAGE